MHRIVTASGRRSFTGCLASPTFAQAQAKATALPMALPTVGALTGAIDCDIHPAVPSTRALLPYFDDYWREHIRRRGLDQENFETSSFPVNAPINGRPDWRLPSGPPGSRLTALQTHLLDRLRPSR